MKYFTSKDVITGDHIRIAYSDYGQGQPVVLIHGWPLSREMWEYQLEDLVNAGCRVIKYDRRGFGKSDKPWEGYDYDTLADDLHALMQQLELSGAALVGFSMGGGEVVRYLSRHGSDRVAKIVLISSIIPFLQKNDDNPEGVNKEVFEEMISDIKDDRINFLEDFSKKFFGVNLMKKPISNVALDYYRMLASHATARSTIECVKSFSQTDFRDELSSIHVPTLIIHGDADRTVPIEASSERTARMIQGCEYKVYEEAPHGLFYTHKKQLNEDLIHFITGEEYEHVSGGYQQQSSGNL